jgi:5'-nucleotidase
VAPDHERSGASQGISLHRTLQIETRSEKEYAVAGTPADCVAIACGHLMADSRPDLILSGINRGPNLGNETLLSGTVGAALTGLMFGIPSVALSLAHRDKMAQPHWETPEFHGPKVLRTLLTAGWPKDVCLNVNFPDTALENIRPFIFTRQEGVA